MRHPALLTLLVTLLVLTLTDVTPALAHQPYFEDMDSYWQPLPTPQPTAIPTATLSANKQSKTKSAGGCSSNY